MKECQLIQIHCRGGISGTTIRIGDQELHNVRSVSFTQDVHNLPVVRLEILALNGVTVSGKALVKTCELKESAR